MNRIIQCPACNTKFAINESQLSGIDKPSFHCSRCNTVFSLDKTSEDNNSKPENQDETSDHSTQTEATSSPAVTSIEKESEENISALDLLRSLQNRDQIQDTEDEAIDKESGETGPAINSPMTEQVPGAELGSTTSWTTDLESKSPETANETHTEKFPEIEELPHGETEVDESQLSLFPDQESYKSLDFISSEEDSQDLEGFTASWESSNPDRPYEADLSSRKTQEDDSSSSTTQVMRRDTLPRSKPSMEDISPQKDSEPESADQDVSSKSLNELFKREARVSKDPLLASGRFKRPDVSDRQSSAASHDISPALVDPESVNKPENIPFSQTESKSSTGYRENEAANRSMKDTTVMKRDEVSRSGFSLQEEDFNEFLEEEESIPQLQRARTGSKRPSFKVPGISVFQFPSVSFSNTYQSFMIAWLPPFLLMIVLCFWAHHISRSSFTKNEHNKFSAYLGEILGLSKPLPITVPPQGVTFNPASAQVAMSTDTSSKWIFINGNVINTSTYVIPRIEIITFFYDKTQNLVGKHNSVLPNSLSETDLTRFREDELKENMGESSQFEFAPNTSSKVTLALRESPNIEWFAARIFSTRL